MYQTNGQGLPHFANPIVERVTLEAKGQDALYRAHYGKTRLGAWKLLDCDKPLDFLRCCGRSEDARAALRKRGFSFHWARSAE